MAIFLLQSGRFLRHVTPSRATSATACPVTRP